MYNGFSIVSSINLFTHTLHTPRHIIIQTYLDIIICGYNSPEICESNTSEISSTDATVMNFQSQFDFQFFRTRNRGFGFEKTTKVSVN